MMVGRWAFMSSSMGGRFGRCKNMLHRRILLLAREVVVFL
jgi:hypothetical protein